MPKIRSIAEDREVPFLLHFTQSANLQGIVKHGLLPRRELEKLAYPVYVSDQHRLDENDAAVSVSISRMNEEMFTWKRERSGHENWLILALSPEILWTHNCRFCWCNAAKKEIKDRAGFLGGPWAFEKMFEGDESEREGLASCFPTNIGAEVQVLENIAPTYIRAVVTNDSRIVEPLQKTLSSLFDGARPLVFVEDYSRG
jgi:hypothetical protein